MERMTTQTTSIPQARATPRQLDLGPLKRAIVRMARSIHDVWDGSSFEPGRHELTRVQQPGERQTPR